MTCHNGNACLFDRFDQSPFGIRANVSNSTDKNPKLLQSKGCAIGIIIIGCDNNATAGERAITVCKTACRSAQHDARQIITREDKRAFMCACCQDHFIGSDFPDTLARHMGRACLKMVCYTLTHGDEIMVHIAKNSGAWQQGHIIHL